MGRCHDLNRKINKLLLTPHGYPCGVSIFYRTKRKRVATISEIFSNGTLIAIMRAISHLRALGASLIHRNDADKAIREIEKRFRKAAFETKTQDASSGGWGEVSVFSPTQIKSATDNIGTFSRFDPNIYRSLPDDDVSSRIVSRADPRSKIQRRIM